MTDFDLAVIGAGPGGLEAALRARELGLKTALIEKKDPGGTCLNTGCIPTKTLLASTRLLSQIRRASEYGLRVRQVQVAFADLMQRKEVIVSRLREAALNQIQKSGIEWIVGTAQFLGPLELSVQGASAHRLRAASVIIATGSEPADLPSLKFDSSSILSSTDALNLKELPESLLIVGGGAVGVEFASFFHSMGVEVTLVEMLPRLLPAEDEDCARRLKALFERRGLRILTETKVQECLKGRGGLKVKLSSREILEAEKILVAVGRRPSTARLELEKAGVRLEKKGAIEVNEYLETTAKGVFAIGDVISSPQLAHVASYEGSLVVDNLSRKTKIRTDYRSIPSCIYSDPEVVSVGMVTSGQDAEAEDVLEVRIPFAAVGKAQIEGETEGFLKLRAYKKDGRILGACAIGARVTELIPEITLAIRLQLKVKDLCDTVHAHPTEAEIIALAAREAARRLQA